MIFGDAQIMWWARDASYCPRGWSFVSAGAQSRCVPPASPVTTPMKPGDHCPPGMNAIAVNGQAQCNIIPIPGMDPCTKWYMYSEARAAGVPMALWTDPIPDCTTAEAATARAATEEERAAWAAAAVQQGTNNPVETPEMTAARKAAETDTPTTPGASPTPMKASLFGGANLAAIGLIGFAIYSRMRRK